MKHRFLIAIALLSMLTVSLSLCAVAADPTPVANPAWDLVMEFDNAADADNWAAGTANDKPVHSVSNGQLHISSTTRVGSNNELRYNGTDLPANDANAYVFETKMKVTFDPSTASADDVAGFGLWAGDTSWASNFVFADKLQARGTTADNKLSWVKQNLPAGFDPSDWHTYRIEATRKAGASFTTYTYYLDGVYFCSTEVGNGGQTLRMSFYANPASKETTSLSVDVEYVKVANSFEEAPTTPDTPENPGNDNNDQPQAPATGIVMIPVVAVAAVSALGLCTVKKRRG